MTSPLMRSPLSIVLFAGVLALAIPRAGAAGPILYNTFDVGDTFASDPYGDDGAPAFQAFHFVATATGQLEQVTVALGRTGAAQVTTVFDLFTGPSTLALGALMETFVVANTVAPDGAVPFTGAPVTFLSVLMPTLTAGQGYWLRFREAEAPNGASSLWFFNSLAVSGPRLTDILPSHSNILPAFRLEATAVPEPATGLLVVCGVLALAGVRRSVRRAK